MLTLEENMLISKIKLHNFRSYELFEVDFSPHGNILIGPNGIGKTNLLEAVYLALQGNSFRGSTGDCIRLECPVATILLETNHETRRVQLQKDGERASRLFTIDSIKSKVLTQKQRRAVVLFEPNELRLITSSPTRRRDFLDGLLSRLDPQFAQTLRRFNRTLLQRNELLKSQNPDSHSWRNNLFAWNIKFVELAQKIAEYRANFLYQNEPQLQNLYASLAGQTTALSIEYLPSVPLDNYQQLLINRLDRSLSYELATGHTSAGPQREDFMISLHGQPAIKIASRGEMRTIMLAFKLLELELQTKISGDYPLILLDDVFSELDQTREQLLQKAIKDHQSILTTTDSRQLAGRYKTISIPA